MYEEEMDLGLPILELSLSSIAGMLTIVPVSHLQLPIP